MLKDEVLKTILNVFEDNNQQQETVITPKVELNEQDREQLQYKMAAVNESASTVDTELYTYSKIVSNIVKTHNPANTDIELEENIDNIITDPIELYRKFLTGLLFEDPSVAKEYTGIRNLIDNILIFVQEKVEQGLLPSKVYVTEDDIKIKLSNLINQATSELTEADYANIEQLVSMESAGVEPDIYRDIISSMFVYSKVIDKLFTKDVFKDDVEKMSFIADRDLLLAEVTETLIEKLQ